MNKFAEIETAVMALPRRVRQKIFKSLEKEFAEKPVKKKPSLHDRMKDLCGIVDSGVTDLATNKKHMEGFGRWKRR
jgi:hypothetical protein